LRAAKFSSRDSASGSSCTASLTVLFVASFFLDGIATIVEREIDPYAAPGRPAPLFASVVMGLRFAVLSILVNILVLLLTLFTGVRLRLVLPVERISPRARIFRARRNAPPRVRRARLKLSGTGPCPVFCR
jgi:hypothetical protein